VRSSPSAGSTVSSTGKVSGEGTDSAATSWAIRPMAPGTAVGAAVARPPPPPPDSRQRRPQRSRRGSHRRLRHWGQPERSPDPPASRRTPPHNWRIRGWSSGDPPWRGSPSITTRAAHGVYACPAASACPGGCCAVGALRWARTDSEAPGPLSCPMTTKCSLPCEREAKRGAAPAWPTTPPASHPRGARGPLSRAEGAGRCHLLVR
jgi:hypothetical protein